MLHHHIYLFPYDLKADHPNQPNTKQVNQNSVKKGCPAVIHVKEVFSFPAHKVLSIISLAENIIFSE